MFVWNYIANWYAFFFFLNISVISADINTVQTTLCSELRSIFQDFLPKKDVTFCETTDTAHSYIKQIVKFSEIKVSNGFTKNCFRILVLCKGQNREINDHHVGIKIILTIKIQIGPFKRLLSTPGLQF